MGSLIEPIAAPARRPPATLRSLLASLIVHVGIIVILWWIALSTIGRQQIELTGGPASPETPSSLQVISDAESPPDPAAAAETPTPVQPLLAPSADDQALQQQFRQSLDPAGVNFFGAQAYGQRFVFVLDISHSMDARNNERYRRAADELLAAVSELRPGQQYYVILFAWETLGINYERKFHYRSADGDHLDQLRRWIDQVPLGPGTDPRRALALAYQMQPDAIFLLSDGEFNTSPTPTSQGGWLDSQGHRFEANVIDGVQRMERSRPIPIHTIAFENPFTLPEMQQIADATGASFHYVPTAHHHPADFERIKQALRSLERLAAGRPIKDAERYEAMEMRDRIRCVWDLISSGELAMAEYLIRPVDAAKAEDEFLRRRIEALRKLLLDELGSTRLEDFLPLPGLPDLPAADRA